MSPRRPFSLYRRLVGEPWELAGELGVPLEEVVGAIEGADLDPWGRNA